MADIGSLSMDGVGAVNLNGNGGIDYITAADAVYFINTNRPTRNLAARDEMLQSKLNVVIGVMDSARGSETDLTARLAVSIEADGSLKASALPDVSAITSEVVAARGAEASLSDKMDVIDGKADNAVSIASEAIAMHEASFEARAEAVRRVTPSGFSSTGIGVGTEQMSSLGGLTINAPDANWLMFGHIPSVVGEQGIPKVVVNGYTIKVVQNFADVTLARFPTPPATGTRQDLAFLESWKEEVPKADGLFFAFGNTQYEGSASVDGATLTDTPSAFTGSAYFTASNGVFAVEAATAPAEFINNPDNNIGVLENGNFFQVRYRIRAVENITYPENLGKPGHYINGAPSLGLAQVDAFRPQGQLASPSTTASHVFAHLPDGIGHADNGIFLGLFSTGSAWVPQAGSSLDGFTYAIPICAVHRRNTGVYSLANQNGTAFENAWIVDTNLTVGGTNWARHGLNGQSLVTIGSSTFKITENPDSGSLALVRRISGTGTPEGTATWNYNGSPQTSVWSNAVTHGGEYLGSTIAERARPDYLNSDIIDRRDVLDLRHKVSLKGDFDEDALYQEAFDLVMKGEYRQEWEQLKAFDNDGNGTGLIDTGIYGNVLTESLGLGATVPDSGINTNITKKLLNNNGTPVGFNGARTTWSDAETTEDFTVVVLDQADGIASKTLQGEDNLVSYNANSHALEIDLTEHFSHVNDLTKDPTLLSGHKPSIKWGNGADVAGVLTRDVNGYNWSFEIKEYGTVLIAWNVGQIMYSGAIYTDLNGKRWIVERSTSGMDASFLPDYTNGNDGSVLPQSGNMTYVSGNGPQDPIAVNSSRYATLTLDSAIFPIGYSSSHETGANESISATFKINYKAGSSCLPELPYGDSIVNGSRIYLGGVEQTLPDKIANLGVEGTSSKTVPLSGFTSYAGAGGIGKPLTGADGNTSPCVLKEGGTYKMWYTASGPGVVSVIAYATSTDGKTWSDHQIVLGMSAGTMDAAGAGGPCVIKDGATYRMWYGGNNGGRWAIGYATSADGITWSKQNSGLAVKETGTQCYQPNVIKDGATYKMWLSRSDGSGYYIAYATSSDGLSWSADQDAIRVNAHGNADIHVESGTVIKDGDLYKMWYHGSDSSTSYARLYYATSTNGINWTYPQILAQDVNHFHYCSVIKDEGAYKIWWSRFVDYEIVYGILAMSDPANVGSSLTGVYTNTSPQVNMGFRSTDTVVLHYERMAQQTETSSFDEEHTFKFKHGFVCNNTSSVMPYLNLHKSDPAWAYYLLSGDVSDYTLGEVLPLASDLSGVLAMFQWSDLIKGLGEFKVTPSVGTSAVYTQGGEVYFTTVLEASSQDANMRVPFYGPKLIGASFNVASSKSGAIKMYVGTDPVGISTDRHFANLFSNLGTGIAMVGRPLIKK